MLYKIHNIKTIDLSKLVALEAHIEDNGESMSLLMHFQLMDNPIAFAVKTPWKVRDIPYVETDAYLVKHGIKNTDRYSLLKMADGSIINSYMEYAYDRTKTAGYVYLSSVLHELETAWGNQAKTHP